MYLLCKRFLLHCTSSSSLDAPVSKYVGHPYDRGVTNHLRHTCATLLLLKGVNAKAVQERLGHASMTLTLDMYSYVLPDMKAQTVEAVEGMFGVGVG